MQKQMVRQPVSRKGKRDPSKLFVGLTSALLNEYRKKQTIKKTLKPCRPVVLDKTKNIPGKDNVLG